MTSSVEVKPNEEHIKELTSGQIIDPILINGIQPANNLSGGELGSSDLEDDPARGFVHLAVVFLESRQVDSRHPNSGGYITLPL